MNRPIVVADSGPLIALAICGHLALLSDVFQAVHIPQAVLDETTADPDRPGSIAIAEYVRAHAQIHASRNDAIYAAAIQHLDEGESQALSLAHALDCGVLMDERRGRQHAKNQGLPLFGVLGVLLQAHRSGRISGLALILEHLQTNGYRISKDLINATLKLSGESS